MFVRLPNVPNVAHNLPVGSRLNPFWELRKPWTWTLGSTNVEGGLHPPFPVKTKLDKVTRIINCYAHPHRNLDWLEALHQLMDKDAVEPVQNHWASSTFLGSKSTQLLETYCRSEQTKPFGGHQDHPTIRGVVTSIDFKDAYFHIPTQEQFTKYLRFHVQGRTYQFKALPFGLSTAPMEFTLVTKELKLMDIHKDIRIHQYQRLVGESQIPPGLSPPHSRSSENMPRTRLAGEFRKIRTGTKAGLQLCRLPVRLQGRFGSDQHRTFGRTFRTKY